MRALLRTPPARFDDRKCLRRLEPVHTEVLRDAVCAVVSTTDFLSARLVQSLCASRDRSVIQEVAVPSFALNIQDVFQWPTNASY